MEDLEQRMLELESRYSFLDDLLQKLNDVIASQQQQIENQVRITQLLQERIQELAEGVSNGSVDSGEEKPPHY